jgi:hypothetical protein
VGRIFMPRTGDKLGQDRRYREKHRAHYNSVLKEWKLQQAQARTDLVCQLSYPVKVGVYLPQSFD